MILKGYNLKPKWTDNAIATTSLFSEYYDDCKKDCLITPTFSGILTVFDGAALGEWTVEPVRIGILTHFVLERLIGYIHLLLDSPTN